MDEVVACWHHGNENRLRKCLVNGYCDLHPLAAKCPKGRMSAEFWFHKKMKLKIGDRVRFCVERRKIVGTGEIESKPYDLLERRGIQPINPNWPGAVDIVDVQWENGGYCPSLPRRGSHSFK